MSKAHNPSPEERDEKFSLYGLNPEKVGEALLKTPPEQRSEEDRGTRRATRRRPKRGQEGDAGE